MPGCYLQPNFAKLVDPSSVKVIVEAGSRDCLDAIALHKAYGVKVYAFECNPFAIKICKDNLQKYNISTDQVELIEAALFDKKDRLDFYPVIKTEGAEKYKDHPDFFITKEGTSANIGASSLFKINKDYQKTKYRNERYHQQTEEPIKVDAVRLDEFMEERGLDSVDLLCMDIQGAELMALRGLGNKLQSCKWIFTELCTSVEKNGKIIENYENQGNINTVFRLLEQSGFKHVLGNPNRFSHHDFAFVKT
ncbi:methyltransferase FkbM family protein [Tetraselmis virus 1]|uniref:Methyltransferase FkbM family protein n=1 Tax=Tetraselmis virus 1 TaxID=2060617 RepID=A0A2P0VP97_9VIRU|nr:methyltransferase FkbM family protein [Tetraselmis virus 1]AUF82690.1 methyltransferase FkbM family protein [Tetraselmis virus 1]